MSDKTAGSQKKLTAEGLRAKGHYTLPEMLRVLAEFGVYFPHGARTIRHLQHKGLIDPPVRAGVDLRRRNVAFYPRRVISQILRLQKPSVTPARQFLALMGPRTRNLMQAKILLRRGQRFPTPEEVFQVFQETFPKVDLSLELQSKLLRWVENRRTAPASETEELTYIGEHVPPQIQLLRIGDPDKTREEFAAMVLGWFAVIHEDLTQGKYTDAIRTAGLSKWLAEALIPWLLHDESASAAKPTQAALPVSDAKQKG